MTYVMRDMTHPEGGILSAEDADSLEDGETTKKKEGAFYVWTKSEIEKVYFTLFILFFYYILIVIL